MRLIRPRTSVGSASQLSGHSSRATVPRKIVFVFGLFSLIEHQSKSVCSAVPKEFVCFFVVIRSRAPVRSLVLIRRPCVFVVFVQVSWLRMRISAGTFTIEHGNAWPSPYLQLSGYVSVATLVRPSWFPSVHELNCAKIHEPSCAHGTKSA